MNNVMNSLFGLRKLNFLPCLTGGQSFAGPVRIWSQLGGVAARLRRKADQTRRAAAFGGTPSTPAGTFPCSSPAV